MRPGFDYSVLTKRLTGGHADRGSSTIDQQTLNFYHFSFGVYFHLFSLLIGPGSSPFYIMCLVFNVSAYSHLVAGCHVKIAKWPKHFCGQWTNKRSHCSTKCHQIHNVQLGKLYWLSRIQTQNLMNKRGTWILGRASDMLNVYVFFFSPLVTAPNVLQRRLFSFSVLTSSSVSQCRLLNTNRKGWKRGTNTKLIGIHASLFFSLLCSNFLTSIFSPSLIWLHFSPPGSMIW